MGGLATYNLVLAAIDAAVLIALRRKGTLRRFAECAVSAGTAVVLLAVPLGVDGFGVLACLACGVFAHAVLLLAATAVLLRRAHARAALTCGALAAVLAGVGADAFFVEPHWLEVTRLRLRSPKLTRPLRLVVLADFQTDEIGSYERGVLRTAMAEGPDLLLFLGDQLHEHDDGRRAVLQPALREAFAEVRLAGTLGAVAVEGNTDDSDWTGIFSGFPVTAVRETTVLELGEVRLTALSPMDARNPRLRVPPSSHYHIVIGHFPDFALGDVAADLLLAGHTHGGQVRLPLIGPLITFSQVPRSWAAGVTDLGGGRALVVSRGIGMERGRAPRLRFLCRPELVVIDLGPE